MATANPEHDRRAEARRDVGAARIAWTRRNIAGIQTGWVSNIARRGVAFITPTRDRPAPGDTIGLAPGSTEPVSVQPSVRVVRVTPYDQYFSLVGCRQCETGSV